MTSVQPWSAAEAVIAGWSSGHVNDVSQPTSSRTACSVAACRSVMPGSLTTGGDTPTGQVGEVEVAQIELEVDDLDRSAHPRVHQLVLDPRLAGGESGSEARIGIEMVPPALVTVPQVVEVDRRSLVHLIPSTILMPSLADLPPLASMTVRVLPSSLIPTTSSSCGRPRSRESPRMTSPRLAVTTSRACRPAGMPGVRIARALEDLTGAALHVHEG